jgi:type I restriction-modification system DNA methylase subunit
VFENEDEINDLLQVIQAFGPPEGKDVHPSLLRQVKTKKTELLFVALILRMLKNGGRSAAIVPDGVLFKRGAGSHCR